jgi:hypothetical protein
MFRSYDHLYAEIYTSEINMTTKFKLQPYARSAVACCMCEGRNL